MRQQTTTRGKNKKNKITIGSDKIPVQRSNLQMLGKKKNHVALAHQTQKHRNTELKLLNCRGHLWGGKGKNSHRRETKLMKQKVQFVLAV